MAGIDDPHGFIGFTGYDEFSEVRDGDWLLFGSL
jgi:hypothetical protein